VQGIPDTAPFRLNTEGISAELSKRDDHCSVSVVGLSPY